ncbi:cell envelope integrity EipB family protein [Ahrensia sp. R2A130]|uniref:cell envelope integrity EipB family protein n=1 Tax=Ahrensia sp. R2A130 TaxID=744979 RepID=UPI0001E0BC1E|nr:cell envelope integrity EipB family protein [Ahrensia sp. R2A130]EFL90177.1 conserved domain protein [Ahrensia sp. R2A130]
MTLRLALISLAISVAPVAHAAGLEGLLPHRAVYDLSLDKSSDRSGITGIKGRIVYEMTGSACEGFATRFRFFTEVSTPRKGFTNDQRTTSFESADGRSFSFVNKSYLNGQLEQDLKGQAEREGDSMQVEIALPEEQSIKLDDAVFMSEHMAQIIKAAKAGETVHQAVVFDGSGDADELMETTAIIGKERADLVEVTGETDGLGKDFAGQSAWPVTVSYFKQNDTLGTGEKTPLYAVSFYMHESGVSRRLIMQYEDYSLRGDLKQIEMLKTEPCK